MSPPNVSRTILVAGAGIGGLTAALALAARGFRVVIFEQAETLTEAGAGIQLPPNATRILKGLGLEDALRPAIVSPEAISVRSARRGEEIVRIPFGQPAAFRYGAPYWIIHRADLQAALLAAVRDHPDIVLHSGAKVEDFATHDHGTTAQVLRNGERSEERGIAMVGADGLWSRSRQRLGLTDPPRFRERTAWRATLPASELGEHFRAPLVHLWLGRDAHLVHYPVRGGSTVNVVAIVQDRWQSEEWTATGSRDDLLRRFRSADWHPAARSLLAKPDAWQKWALHDRPPDRKWGIGTFTLLGDAAHPMVPFLAQGASMAIEDAAMLALYLSAAGEDLAGAMRRYEGVRRARTRRVQRAAVRTGDIYHKDGAAALMRDMAMKAIGGERLRARYDWLYDWRCE
jgi:salicylate hydroxylase